ncbi:MAG: winged helix-turn-helix domain-containing protein [Candidatus Thermoplasmatota archaeon]|jgi:predicted NUDIX family NTP pyrophosphohydrolase|nr:winged helix-turn-helix domain-containing protein [Candidatus Thermoplasmatota archaeon]
MNNIIEEFGLNAGKVWQVLNSQGALTQTKIMKTAKLKEDEFFAAVGWLARENKICREGPMYRLGQTNLTSKIGTNAGKVWNVLSKQKEADISAIAKLTKLQPKDAYSALGWLARENKIEVKNVKPIEHEFTICLK